MVQYLVEEGGADATTLNGFGETAASVSLYLGGSRQILEYLMERSAVDLSVRDKLGFSILHTACNHDCFDAVQFLVDECGADLDSKVDDGRTCLHIACATGSLRIAKYIVARRQARKTKIRITQVLQAEACQRPYVSRDAVKDLLCGV